MNESNDSRLGAKVKVRYDSSGPTGPYFSTYKFGLWSGDSDSEYSYIQFEDGSSEEIKNNRITFENGRENVFDNKKMV